MRTGRRSYAERTRAKLLDLWTGEEDFGRPLGCVTTTFTFDAELFEEQCLARFLSIQSNPNETAKAYLIEREEKLSQCFSCVLVDRAHAAPDRSLRWNLLPVTLPKGGVLHAKLTLLVWENCVRLLIGSANLTEPGYRRNQEVIAGFDFGHEENSPPEVLVGCVGFLNEVRRFSPGYARADGGPHAALAAFLRSVEQWVKSLRTARRSEVECVLVPLLPGGTSVIEQLRALWKGPAPVEAHVLSPFYDKEMAAPEAARSLAHILTTRGNRFLSFTAPGRELSDGTMQIDIPASLKNSSHASLEHRFSFVRERLNVEGKEEDRSLHAKSVWLERDNRALYMLGSSNFTAAGLGLHAGHNIELNVAYLINDCSTEFGKLCRQSRPVAEKLNNLEGVQFLIDGQTDSEENPDLSILPAAFGLALYFLDDQGGRLELEIGGKAPMTFEVCSHSGDLLIDAAAWLHDGKPENVAIRWEAKRPPSSVEVRWHDNDVGKCAAQWIVNVADMSSLPPPEELGSLSLSELMEILTSARPMHEVMMRILERREKKSACETRIEVDPHNRVDTSQFLLQRMRRVARALEGMRERLQQPVGSKEALQWRLLGPIGPVALAKRLAEGDPSGAAFMIAEVAATLRGVAWRPSGSLNAKAIQAHVDHTIGTLHELAAEAQAPTNLAEYVRASFRELLA
jgi:hypothetical protein